MRGVYGELVVIPESVKAAANSIVSVLAESGQVQKPYLDFDRKQRGSCLNYDLYGYDVETGLFVFQARQAYRRAARHMLSTRKTYALAGYNENGSAFWHPISSAIVHAAIREDALNPTLVVIKAMAWIFGVNTEKLTVIVRQGDVALVPAKPKGEKLSMNVATLADTHVLVADELRSDGETMYAFNPMMRHNRNQHGDVSASGWYRVSVGRAARAWDFSPRSID